MKKTIKIITLMALALTGAFAITSCGSTKVEDPRGKIAEAPKDEIDKVVVVDWTDRTMGEISAPTWLKNMTRGNSDTFKEQWSIPADRVVKFSRATGKTEAIAQALSRAGFAYTQAAELNQKVIGRVGQGLNDVGQLEALFVAASETKADADKKDAQKQAEEKRAYDAQMARLETERTKAIEQTATAKLNAQEAQAKQAAAEADLLASYLM